MLALSATGLTGLAGCSGGGNGSGGSSCGPGENKISAVESDFGTTVTITGQVVSFDSTTATAVIDDGTGQAGVRMGTTNISDPAEGDCITVTGTTNGGYENAKFIMNGQEASMAGNNDNTSQ
jgi:hypothetical protein